MMADESSVPYFNWFAEESKKHSDLKLSFISLNPFSPQMLDDMKQRSCDCYWIQYDTTHRKSSMLKAIPQLYLLFRKIRPDVVHTHLFDDSLPGLIAAKLAGIKVRIITKQDTGFHWNYKPFYVFFDRINNFLATYIHTVASESNQFVLEKEKAKAEKVHLIRNGFPYKAMTNSNEQTVTELRNQYNLENKFVIGTVARLIEWKGHQLIIQAAEKLATDYPNIKFIWAGTGDSNYKTRLIEMIKKKNLENNIVFTDWIDRSKMPSFYKSLNMYLHPAIKEPFGFAISEALMNKIAVACTKTGSSDFIIHKKEGFMLRENNVDDIVNSIKYYYNNPEITRQIAEAGHNYSLKNLTFDKMWAGHVALYKKGLVL